MAVELSSNWKRLQAKIKSESTKPKALVKRKSSGDDNRPVKRRKAATTVQKLKAPHPATGKENTSQMGAAQSSTAQESTELGTSASLSLWALDNDISPEDLAEAYGLGLKNGAILGSDKDRINEGLAENIELGKYVAMDCEMVGVGEGGYESSLARISLVDFHGRQIYDSYVRPKERVTDWRTAVSGIGPKQMRFARDFDQVRTQISELLKDRILVGHDLKHDLDALMLSHPARNIRDTACFSGFRKYGNGRKPALRNLAEALLGVDIQKGAHSSIEDAKVAMALFRKHKPAFDVETANRFPTRPSKSQQPSKSTKKSKKKRKA